MLGDASSHTARSMKSPGKPHFKSSALRVLLGIGFGLSLLLAFRPGSEGEGSPEGSNIVALDFNASADRLLAGTLAGEVFLLNVQNERVLGSWQTRKSWLDRRPAPFNSIALAPNGNFAIYAGTTALKRIVFARSPESAPTIDMPSLPFGGAAISPTGKQVAAISVSEKLLVWNLDGPGTPLDFGKADASVFGSSAFSPDGTRIALAGHTLRMLDARTGAPLWSRAPDNYANLCVAFRFDGKVLASGSQDSTIKLCSADTGIELSTLRGHHGYVDGVAFSPDGKTLASWTRDGQLFLWDLTVTPARIKTKLAGSTGGAAFSPDGRWLATGESRKTVGLWDAQTGNKVRDLSITAATPAPALTATNP